MYETPLGPIKKNKIRKFCYTVFTRLNAVPDEAPHLRAKILISVAFIHTLRRLIKALSDT